MNLTVIGAGYVGLVAAACFAENGHKVFCVDKDKTKIENLKKGIVEIFEPGLNELILKNVNNNLVFTNSLKFAVENSSVCFIAVGTPSLSDGSADLSCVFKVADEISSYINSDFIVVNKSTVPIGTVENIEKILKKNVQNFEVEVASNPEFLRQGSAVSDFLTPERIVIGAKKQNVFDTLKAIYQPFFYDNNKILCVNIKSAEMIKYASNAFLATKISFINEIANICEKVNANIKDVQLGMGFDKRIGKNFLESGIGYGGSCFPKDVKALIQIAKNVDTESKILEACDYVNQNQVLLFVEKIVKKFNYDLEGKNVAIWGLSFKPETNDIREAPSLKIIEKLLKLGAKIKAYDPKAMKEVEKIFSNQIEYSKSASEAAENADCLLIVTQWQEFVDFNLKTLKDSMKTPLVFDGRNIFSIAEMQKHGFSYQSIGRNSIESESVCNI